jgi:hypothetical protein
MSIALPRFESRLAADGGGSEPGGRERGVDNSEFLDYFKKLTLAGSYPASAGAGNPSEILPRGNSDDFAVN